MNNFIAMIKSLNHKNYIIVSVVIFILFSCSENSENSFAEINIQATEDASVKLALEKELSKIPISTPISTPTPLPTATVLPTSTPKLISTSTPKPTSTPEPTSTPKLTPTPKPTFFTKAPKPTSTSTPTPTPTPTPIPDLITDFKISATDLLSEFGTTSTPEIDFYKRSQANAKYLNKVLEVTGRITMTGYNNGGNDILNNPKMDVGIGDSQIYFKQVFCELSGNIIENINELKLQQELQQEITLQGIYKEDTFFSIKLISCKRIKD